MTREEIVTTLKSRYSGQIIDFLDKSKSRIYMEIKPESLRTIAAYVFKELEARFNTASGVDNRFHIEILYHFTIDSINLLISFRVKVNRENPVIDSLTSVFKGADFIEREMHELLGIEFTGQPDKRRLLLSDQWPEGVHPLRSDYKEWDSDAIRDRGV
ncbi:MAG: NADH-quinone oxidoreductase subunit C [Spirochaetales bacterium]|nr:NADH-quinone oxidoreductase subunit C [Spirochaetales bacterium]